MIEWLPGEFTGGIKAVDLGGRSVKTEGDTYRADVVNVIPPQMAGQLAQQTGLADRSGWCPVDPTTFESTLVPGIYVVGDATSSGQMAKSAFGSNSQAKVCAFAIVAALAGSERAPPHLFNSCFTYLAPDDGITSAISYKAATGTIKVDDLFLSAVGESAERRRQIVQQADGWYAAFTHDVFG